MSRLKGRVCSIIFLSSRKKEDEVCLKIRTYSVACLSNIFKNNNKVIPQYFATFLPCKILRKDVVKFTQTFSEPLLISSLAYPERRNKRATLLIEFKSDFNEPTLLHLLMYEENTKLRISICKAISALLDGYSGDKLLLTIDGRLYEKI